MNSLTKGTISSIVISIVIGGMIGFSMFDQWAVRLFFAAYFAMLGLATGLVISWDKRKDLTDDYFSYVLYGSLSFLVLDMSFHSYHQGALPDFSLFIVTMLLALGALQGLAYRCAALPVFKSSSKSLKSKGPTK